MAEAIDISPLPKTLGTRSGQGWCIPRPVRNFGLKLLAQQLWCWGRDIERSSGNLLTQFGLRQHRYSGSEDRSTCYRFDDENLSVCLWGFGLFYGCAGLGGLFLGRFDFCPQWSPVDSLSKGTHRVADLPPFGRPSGLEQWRCAHRLWPSMLEWVSGYENWVRSEAGVSYRRKCVDSWMRPYVIAGQMPSAWQFLSRRKWEMRPERVSQTFRKYTITRPK